MATLTELWLLERQTQNKNAPGQIDCRPVEIRVKNMESVIVEG